jgi:DNA-binding CsgD family transcriptional regulator
VRTFDMAKQAVPKLQRRYRLRHHGEDVDVTGPTFVIGREADCQLVLKQDLVSRHHARIAETPDGLVVEDLGSLNGVFVNQRRIGRPTLLAHGDVLGIGVETLELVDVQLVPRAAKPTRPQPPPSQRDVDGPEPVTAVVQLDVLSAREREVFELIVLGHTQREIAEQLHISVKTIETHRAHIASKLNCRSRAELVAYAISAGILRKPPV